MIPQTRYRVYFIDEKGNDIYTYDIYNYLDSADFSAKAIKPDVIGKEILCDDNKYRLICGVKWEQIEL